MALSDYEKAIIRHSTTTEIMPYEEKLAVSELKDLAKGISDIIGNPKTPNSDYFTFQEIINNPERIINTTDKAKDINRPVELARPTIGEVRKYLIEFVDEIIADQVTKQKLSIEQMEWNREELFGLVEKMPHNNVNVPLIQESISEAEEEDQINIDDIMVADLSFLFDNFFSPIEETLHGIGNRFSGMMQRISPFRNRRDSREEASEANTAANQTNQELVSTIIQQDGLTEPIPHGVSSLEVVVGGSQQLIPPEEALELVKAINENGLRLKEGFCTQGSGEQMQEIFEEFRNPQNTERRVIEGSAANTTANKQRSRPTRIG